MHDRPCLHIPFYDGFHILLLHIQWRVENNQIYAWKICYLDWSRQHGWRRGTAVMWAGDTNEITGSCPPPVVDGDGHGSAMHFSIMHYTGGFTRNVTNSMRQRVTARVLWRWVLLDEFISFICLIHHQSVKILGQHLPQISRHNTQFAILAPSARQITLHLVHPSPPTIAITIFSGLFSGIFTTVYDKLLPPSDCWVRRRLQ